MSIGRTDPPPPPAMAALLGDAVRHSVGGRRSLIALGALALALGIAFNWSWIAAAGIAPLLLSALPCIAMCALGLCASRMMNSSCEMSSSSDIPPNVSPQTPAFPEERTDASIQSPQNTREGALAP
jgi:hypothetical protein